MQTFLKVSFWILTDDWGIFFFFFWSVFIYCKLYLFCINPWHCFHKRNKIFYMMSLFSLYACVWVFFTVHLLPVFMSFIKSLRSSNRPTGSQPPCLTSGNDIGLDTTFFYEFCVVQKGSGTIQWTFYLTTEHSIALFCFCFLSTCGHSSLSPKCSLLSTYVWWNGKSLHAAEIYLLISSTFCRQDNLNKLLIH